MHLDGVALSSEWMQVVFPYFTEENPNTSRILTGVRMVLCCHPNGCTLELFRNFSTLMSVRTHNWAIWTETKC
jgi:hypothetical protein